MAFYITGLEYLGRNVMVRGKEKNMEAKRAVTLEKKDTMPSRDEVLAAAKKNPKVKKVWVMEWEKGKKGFRKAMDVIDIPEEESIKEIRARKYGGEGEGEDHKKLKEWIAAHPEFLGLLNVTKNPEIEEHVFPSQDTPDIVFTHTDGKMTVVEIETSDNTELPGAYQALKYRVLLCAEKSLPLDSPSIKAFLVAWSIPKKVEEFCKKYGIETREKKI